jgi:hypothetical protein
MFFATARPIAPHSRILAMPFVRHSDVDNTRTSADFAVNGDRHLNYSAQDIYVVAPKPRNRQFVPDFLP